VPRRRRDKLDGIDADEIRKTTASPGWQLIRQRVETALTGKLAELEQPSDAVATAQLRGFIAGLRLALKVPEILIREGEDRAEKMEDRT
jgi:hypothetical protein